MTDSVADLLAEAAKATAGVDVPAPKKERVKKTLDGAAAEPKTPKTPKEPKAKKEPKAPKQYPQANEDGTQKFEEDGVTPVLGPKETAFKEPKAPRGPRGSNVFLDTQVLNKVEGKGSNYREGSKRKQFFDLVTPGITVADYYAAAGGKSVGHTYLVWYISGDQSVSIE